MNLGNLSLEKAGPIPTLLSEFESFLQTNNLDAACIVYFKDHLLRFRHSQGYDFANIQKEKLISIIQENVNPGIIDTPDRTIVVIPIFPDSFLKAAIIICLPIGANVSAHSISLKSKETISVAIALDYVNDFERERVAAEKQNAMVDTAMQAVLNGFLGKENNFQTTLIFLLELFEWKIGSLWEYHDNEAYDDPSYLTLEATCNHDISLYKHNCLKRGQGIIWRVLDHKSPKILPVENAKREDLVNVDLYDNYYSQPLLLLRLEAGGKIYGAACLNGLRPKEDAYLERHLKTFENIAAIELKAKSLEGRATILKRISDILINIGKRHEDVCKAATKDLLSLLNCEGVSIFLKPDLSTDIKQLFLMAAEVATGVKESDALARFHQGESVMYDEDERSLTGTVSKKSKTILDNQVIKNPLNSGRFRETDDRSNDTWLGSPLKLGDKCIGVIRCAGKRTSIGGKLMPYIFDGFDAEVVNVYAKILVPALQLVTSIRSLELQRDQLQLASKIREHEMTAPLAGIASNAGFVMRHLTDEGYTSKPKKLNGIISDAEMCAFLLKTHKIPTGKAFEESMRYISISSIVQSVAKFLRRQIEQRSHTITTQDEEGSDVAFNTPSFMRINIMGSIPFTMGVKHLLQRAFYNLGINAVKYGKRGGRLDIKMFEEYERRKLIIEFQDDGIGIFEDEKEDIFYEGFRGTNVRDKYKGAGEGLGLTIARDIIEAHNGFIELIKCGSPTVFRVTLPLIRPEYNTDIKMPHPSIIRADRFVLMKK